MASTSQVDGLISGLSTAQLINQLMSLEARPQELLVNKRATAQGDAGDYRNANTRFATMRAAADKLLQPNAFTAAAATSSSTSVAVSAIATAPTASLTMDVTQVAARHTVISAQTWTAATDPFAAGATLDVTVGGVTTNIPTAATLADTVSAINAGNFGLSASSVQTAPGVFRLQLTAKDSGVAKSFTAVSGAESFTQVVTAGQDAKVHVGGVTGYDVTSPSNVFEGLLSGVGITVSTVTTGVTVSVGQDTAAVAKKVGDMVSDVNQVLKLIRDYTDPKDTKALLRGDSTLRGFTQQILSAVSTAVGGMNSASEAGIQLSRDGNLVFDAAKFTTALTADPALAKKIMAGTPAGNGVDGILGTADDVLAVDGIATRIKAIGEAASNSTTGTLSLKAASKDKEVTDLTERIASWDIRLQLRQAALEKTYASLEVALGALKNQSNWLSSQLAQLPSGSSN